MNSYRLTIAGAALLILLSVGLGCGGSSSERTDSPVSPSLTGPASPRSAESVGHHVLLGLYSCRLDPEIPDLELVPLRDAMFHLNALRFLEPPPPVRITLSNFEFDGERIDVDVMLIHPFGGLPRYTGFDVCGTVITSGSITGFNDPDRVVAGEGDTRLVNADGLTRWWNPREFPYNEDVPMWGYIDGRGGTPDEIANYTATLNGYKYHADGLSVYDDLTELDPAMRGAFSAGQGHTRHYTIEVDAGLVFNYAIDACWLPPDEEPVQVPDSFPPGANRDEPYLILCDVTENTFWYDQSTGSGGGELGLDIHCYDWFNADQNTVRVESPGVFDPVTTGIPVGGDEVFSTYHVDISNPTLSSDDPVTVWVSAEAGWDYDGFLPGKPTSAYMVPFEVDVATGEPVLIWRDEGVIDHPLRPNYNDIEPALIVNGEGNVLLSFLYWWQDIAWFCWPRFATSVDRGHTFGTAQRGYFQGVATPREEPYWNAKYTLGSNGQAFHTFGVGSSHVLQQTPWGGDYPDPAGGSILKQSMERAGEMLYTVEGYPMMFSDYGGTITMRRGDYPNEAGTGSPDHKYEGTEYTLVEGVPGNLNWLSLARSTGKTSDGLSHLMYWNSSGFGYIRMISTTDISGTSWTEPIIVFAALAEIWVGGTDPSLWIDDNDGFHVLFAGELWWGEYQLVYGYSADGTDWSEITSFDYLNTFPVDDGLNDTQVVLFDAFDYTWVFLCYETAGNVWCRYKKFGEEEFSDPIQVNEHAPAALPDIYPNGDVGVVFAYEADDGTGEDLTDIFYRLAEFMWD